MTIDMRIVNAITDVVLELPEDDPRRFYTTWLRTEYHLQRHIPDIDARCRYIKSIGADICPKEAYK